MRNKIRKKEKGITLIALVITIIVLLILAGVAISMLSGDNGILKQAAEAKMQTEEQSTIEQIKLAAISAMTNPTHSIQSQGDLETALANQGLDDATVTPIEGGYKVTVNGIIQIISNSGNVRNESEVEKNQGRVLNENGNTPVKDEYGNTIVVPAKFAITKDASRVEDGIVVTDDVDENGNSTGNEFVWIPVNEVKTSKGTKTVTLGRYDWNETTGEGTTVQSVTTEAKATSASAVAVAVHNSYYYEVIPANTKYGSYSNAKAKDLEKFLKSAVKNGGYYIARYEAGINGTKNNYTLSKESTATATTVKPQSKKGLGVWDYIKQADASKVSQAMYNDINFTSDLINSYAWDTAIVFIQKMKDDLSYANMRAKSKTETLKTTGTNMLYKTSALDEQCNIYDMAGNVSEWSTECSGSSSQPCVVRGGYYDTNSYFPLSRHYPYEDKAFGGRGFRPLLYAND